MIKPHIENDSDIFIQKHFRFLSNHVRTLLHEFHTSHSAVDIVEHYGKTNRLNSLAE